MHHNSFHYCCTLRISKLLSENSNMKTVLGFSSKQREQSPQVDKLGHHCTTQRPWALHNFEAGIEAGMDTPCSAFMWCTYRLNTHTRGLRQRWRTNLLRVSKTGKTRRHRATSAHCNCPHHTALEPNTYNTGRVYSSRVQGLDTGRGTSETGACLLLDGPWHLGTLT